MARRWIATRVIMHKDEACRLEFTATTQNMPEADLAAGDITLRDRIDGEQSQMVVNVQGKQPFVRFLA